MNNKTKLSLCVLSSVSVIAFALTVANLNGKLTLAPKNILANDTCAGNHYIAQHETFTEDGLNEMWICCKHHEIYNYIDEINDYDASNWEDTNAPFLLSRKDELETEARKDKAFRKAAFKDVTTYGDATVDPSTGIINVANSGFALTNKTYNDVEFTVQFNSASTVNPYWNPFVITNSLLLGASYSNGKLTGFAIDVSEGFIELLYLDGEQGDVYTSIGCLNDTYKKGNYANQNLHIKISGFHLNVSNDSSSLLDCDLVFPSNNFKAVYCGGSIGFIGKDATNWQLSFSDLVYKNAPTFKTSRGNDWTFYGNTKSSFSASTSGYIISREKYNSFNAHIYVDSWSNYNSWGTTSNITPRNAFVFGVSENSDGTLSGYVLDFEGNYAFLLKLENGIASKPYGEVYVTVDYTNYKWLEISLTNNVITFSSGSSTQNVPLGDDVNGSIGYLSNQVSGDQDYQLPYNVRMTAANS